VTLQTLEQVRPFMADNAPVSFTLTDTASVHAWMTETLRCLAYRTGYLKSGMTLKN